ncbi:hypothetical protein EV175_003827 [Coemansia sp. RSA 1933]|nr:hypothetical protein EV175_003827 [Coemansia sp. RSA 1933]
MAQPPPAAGRTRAREKLRSFYNIQASNRPAAAATTTTAQRTTSTSTSTSKTVSQRGINTAQFDSKKYLKRLLTDESIDGLLRTDNQLVGEIRKIDGDMKTMVYENYSKFISATETIGRMKEDADYMDAEMEKLARRISTISNRADALNAKFAARNDDMLRLSSEHKLLQRLQFLSDLPDQLSAHIGRGEFVEAARLWSHTQPLLDHYRQLGVFAGVEKDGKEIMASVEATIWRRWREDPATEISQGAECASLLVLLRPECAPLLWREYLEIQGVKHRNLRQVCLEAAYELPAVAGGADPAAADAPLLEPDPSGTPLPALAASPPLNEQQQVYPEDHVDGDARTSTRIAHFNAHYLPVWNSLVVGFVSQFVSPAGSGLLEQVGRTQQTAVQEDAAGGRTMSLLEATTEGTVVGLLSPLSDAAAAAVAGSSRSASELAHLHSQGKREQVVVGWQAMGAAELSEAQRVFAEHAREWCAEYEFIVDSLVQFPEDATAANVQPHLEQLDDLVSCVAEYPILARIGGLHECVQRIVSSWHQHLVDGALRAIVRDMIERLEYYFDPAIDSLDGSAATNTQQQLQPLPPPAAPVRDIAASLPRRSSASRHQRNASVRSTGSQASARPGSVVSGTWPNVGQHNDAATQQQQQAAVAHSPPNTRGLAHARAVSSAFEALSMSPGASASGETARKSTGRALSSAFEALAMSPGGLSASGDTARRSISRAGTLRRTREQRIYSSTFSDMLDDDRGATPQTLRRSFSTHHRPPLRRYRPWLVGSVNRNTALHVFLADTESWLIQQILERVNPLLEAVVQHYLDIEGSQLLSDDGPRRSVPSLQTATRMRQAFIATLDRSLDAWMHQWIPDAFLFAALAAPPHGTQRHVETELDESAMAQLGMRTVSDPVCSLLLARFAVDFELTLTQSIYQLCEHGISLTADEAPPSATRRGMSAASSAEASLSNLLSARADAGGGSESVVGERLYSMTAPMSDHLPGDRLHSMTRADSMASIASRRGTTAPRVSVLRRNAAAHTAKWRLVASRLVRNFVMTVGQDIAADYQRMQPYGSAASGAARAVATVSDVWLSICRWMKQVEEDTNRLFYDPVFSETLKPLECANPAGDPPADRVAKPTTQRSGSAKQQTTQNQSVHAHILSNIDRLFAERVDVFPKTVSPLTSGKILFHLAMQIIKAALEALQLRPPVLTTAAQFQQLVIDATFVRAWMLRYAGVSPNLEAPSDVVVGSRDSSTSTLPVNELDARAVQNLVDDWIRSAKACAVDKTLPDQNLVDRVVYDAWMSAYFGYDVSG